MIISDVDFEILCQYVRETADQVGLRDWSFIVKRDAPSKDSRLAEISCAFGRKCATIWFCNDFRTQDPATQVYGVVHELMHCHMAGVDSLALTALVDSKTLTEQQNAIFYEGFLQEFEYGIDGIATFVARGFPPIPWSAPQVTTVDAPPVALHPTEPLLPIANGSGTAVHVEGTGAGAAVLSKSSPRWA